MTNDPAGSVPASLVGQHGAQEAGLVDGDARAQSMLAAQRQLVGDVVEAVGVHERPAGTPSRRPPRLTEPGSLRLIRISPDSASGVMWSYQWAAGSDVDRRVPQRIGPVGQHPPPHAEVGLGGIRPLRSTAARWWWTIAAPASKQAWASATSSSSLIGTFGLRDFFVAPLMAASMMTASAIPDVYRDGREAADMIGAPDGQDT